MSNFPTRRCSKEVSCRNSSTEVCVCGRSDIVRRAEPTSDYRFPRVSGKICHVAAKSKCSKALLKPASKQRSGGQEVFEPRSILNEQSGPSDGNQLFGTEVMEDSRHRLAGGSDNLADLLVGKCQSGACSVLR